MAKKSNKNTFLEHRLTSLEISLKEARDDIINIRDNHLTKLYDKTDYIEKKLLNRLPGWAVIIITFLSSLSVALLVLLLK